MPDEVKTSARGGESLGTKWIREYLSFSKTNLCGVTMLCWGSQLEKSDRGPATEVHQSHLFQVSSFFTSQGDIYLEYTCKVQPTDWMVQCFIIFHTLMIQYDRKRGREKRRATKKKRHLLFGVRLLRCLAAVLRQTKGKWAVFCSALCFCESVQLKITFFCFSFPFCKCCPRFLQGGTTTLCVCR